MRPHAPLGPSKSRGVTALPHATGARQGQYVICSYRRPIVHPALCQVRDTEFPMVREYTYLNTASQGPWPTRTVQAVQEAATAMAYVNTPRGMPESAPAAAQARERLARLLHAAPDDLVWTSNTTHGLNIVA